jgi:serine/threonine protein kinase
MAPEAARGGRSVDKAADVFAFGIMACEMLTGRAPFALPAVFAAMANEPLPQPSLDGVPGDLRTMFASCLAADPALRPAISEVRDALAANGAGRGEP